MGQQIFYFECVVVLVCVSALSDGWFWSHANVINDIFNENGDIIGLKIVFLCLNPAHKEYDNKILYWLKSTSLFFQFFI